MSSNASVPTITEVTRRAIFDDLSERSIIWHGRLDEAEFLSDLFSLKTLPSNDPRYKNAAEDINQHCPLGDWPGDWIFWDERFGLLRGPDDAFLRFIQKMVHPIVRPDVAEARSLVGRVNKNLRHDGWELCEDGTISGSPTFLARRVPKADAASGVQAVAEAGFPLDINALLASMFEVLRERGAAREIAILAHSSARGYQSDYDNLDGGTYSWSLSFAVDLSLYRRLLDEDRDAAEIVLTDVAGLFFSEFSNDHLQYVRIRPRPVTNERWRADAEETIAGHGITNQGRVNSANLPSLTCDGLLFRSEPEIHLYRALKSLGVTFAPLPVFLRGGESYSRLEPDFVVLKDGIVMVVEVDGDTYHRESPAEAHKRLMPLDHEGAKIERVAASECQTPEAAKACAKKLLQTLEKRIAAR